MEGDEHKDNTRCPCCGYCPACGRRDDPVPWYPAIPWWLQHPVFPMYPIEPAVAPWETTWGGQITTTDTAVYIRH